MVPASRVIYQGAKGVIYQGAKGRMSEEETHLKRGMVPFENDPKSLPRT